MKRRCKSAGCTTRGSVWLDGLCGPCYHGTSDLVWMQVDPLALARRRRLAAYSRDVLSRLYPDQRIVHEIRFVKSEVYERWTLREIRWLWRDETKALSRQQQRAAWRRGTPGVCE